jgi:hypothetical protein
MQRSRYEARCSAATVGRCEKTCEAINAVVGLKGPEARLTVTSVLIVHQNRGPVSGSHIFRNAHLMDAGGRIRLGEYNFLPLQLLAAHLVSSLRRHGCRIG